MAPDETQTLEASGDGHRTRRRDAILNAAERLFIEQGFDRTSLAEIVRCSGGSLATLYEMFGNKRGLLHMVAIRWRDETMAERALQGPSFGQSNLDTLLGYVRSEREIWRSPWAGGLIRILVSEGLRDRDFAFQTYRDLRLPLITELSTLFAEWAAAGSALIDDPEATAHLFLSTISGDIMLSRLFGFEEEILDESQILWRLRPFLSHFGISE